ncbi:MAG: 5'/3'-nucleotidase SurE [Planctomycetota bacterium]
MLLTNDDGIEADGLRAMHRSMLHAFQTLGQVEPKIFVVAPDRGRSECSHSIETSIQLKLQQHEDNWYSVNGTPVDCIRVALFAMNLKPDIVFSGINAGANLGVNLMVSGTFAAAREASLLGVPAMAASHYRRPEVDRTWDHASAWMFEPIKRFLNIAESGTFHASPRGPHPPLWNVNLPAIRPKFLADGNYACPSLVECDVDRCPIDREGAVGVDGNIDFQLDFHGRAREPDRDVKHCFDGKTTISSLSPL